MPPTEPTKYPPGQTALIAKIPEAEPLVSKWRSKFDPAAPDGVPAHITILYPFLNHNHIDDEVLTRLTTLIATHPEFNVEFPECQRFPGVLYLTPSPSHPFKSLTQAITEHWPEVQPYEGRFAEIIPHLTVAQEQDPQTLNQVETDLTNNLPLTAQIHKIHLLVTNGTHWQESQTFNLQSTP